MEAATLLQLPGTGRAMERVQVSGEHIVIENLTIADAGLATFMRGRPEADHAALAARAIRIGLIALQDAGASLDVDLVRREFEAMMRQAEALNDRVAAQVDEILRANFADGEGRLPRTLEAFLGDRGELRTFTRDLFDGERRDSAIGRMRLLAGQLLRR